MKKLVSLLLILSLILTSSLVVYADDSDTSAPDPEVSESEVTQDIIDSQIHKLAENIVALESINATKATHDVNDVYNLIYTYFTYGQTGSTAGLPSATYNIVTQINNKLQAVMSSANSINTYTSSILDQITGAEGTTITLYDLIGDLLESIFDQLTITGSSGTVYGAAELLLLIESDIDDVMGKLDTLNQYVLTLSNIVASIQSISSTISSNSALIAQSNSSIASNTADTVNQLNNLRSDFNNINWLQLSNLTFELLDSSFNSINFGNYNGNYILHYHSNYAFYIYNGSILRFDLPVYSQFYFRNDSFIKINDIYNRNSKTGFSVKYYLIDSFINRVNNHNVYTVILYFPDLVSNDLYFDIDLYRVNGTYNIYNFNSVYYIPYDSLDYYNVMDNSILKHINNISNKFEQLYASDDLIAAKEEQQPYESQAIEDFTGNGSAAASTTDLGDLKSVSGTIKSGLASGGSVSNALAPFDANGGFWDWFKQDNYNNINNLSGSSNMLRSAPNQPEVIDFYSDNQLTLQGLLGGN